MNTKQTTTDKKTMGEHTILDLLKQGGISAALIAILLYFGTLLIGKLDEVQKDLIGIRVQLTTMKATLLNREDIEDMVDKKIDVKIRELQLKYHK